jgi:hypothetical protein
MEPLIVIYSGLTVILLIACAIILHDKIIDRRAQKESRARASVTGRSLEGTMLRQVIAGLEELPDDASFTQIKAVLDRAALESVPEHLRSRLLEVFGDAAIAGEWLTTKIMPLGGRAPIDTLMRADGEEAILAILGRIEHGVFS